MFPLLLMVAFLAGRTQRSWLRLTSHECRGIPVVTGPRVVTPMRQPSLFGFSTRTRAVPQWSA